MEPGAGQYGTTGFLPHDHWAQRFALRLSRSRTTCFQPVPSHSTGGILRRFSASSQPRPSLFSLFPPDEYKSKITKRTQFTFQASIAFQRVTPTSNETHSKNEPIFRTKTVPG